MDPLSISAAVIAFLGASNATVRAILNVRNARTELYGLLNEIADINLVLCHASDLVQDSDNTISSSTTYGHLLKLCTNSKDKIDQIHTHINHISGDLASNNDEDARQKFSARARMKWIKEKHLINDLRDELRELRHNISTCVGEITRFVTSLILTWKFARSSDYHDIASMCNALL